MLKSKTVWASLTTLVAVAASIATGEATITEGLQIAVPAILALFLRHGIAKTQDAAEAAVEAASSVTPAPKKKSTKKA
jgi:4-hydroxybenzoate polyprenyltransferase